MDLHRADIYSAGNQCADYLSPYVDASCFFSPFENMNPCNGSVDALIFSLILSSAARIPPPFDE